MEDLSYVRGLITNVREETISLVTGLRRRWFERKEPLSIAKTDFLEEGEEDRPMGCGKAPKYISHPWDQLVFFLKKYITYEGR